MRMKITDLNQAWPNGIVIKPGALKTGTDVTPVMLGDSSGPIVGRASEFVETDDAIYANVELLETAAGMVEKDLNLFDARVFVQPFTADSDKNVTDGKVRGLTLKLKDC